MSAVITSIFIAPTSGAPMISIDTAELLAGCGIVGDRYFRAPGICSAERSPSDDWQITLVESEELDLFLAAEGLAAVHGAFRRNIVTAGVRLNPLVNRRFRVADLELEGMRLCEPCAYLANLISPKLLPAMAGRCGLRARILSSGQISVGANIQTCL